MFDKPHLPGAAMALYENAVLTDDRATIDEARFALNYLDAFGYLARELTGWKDISLADVASALGAFQAFFGLVQTGGLTAQTVRAMESYRCGLPDVVRPDSSSGRQVMAMQAFADTNLARWRKTGLSYFQADYVPGLSQSAQQQIVAQAFNAWTRVAKLQIGPAASAAAADIVISTGQGQRSNFDGPGGVLAWAYLPDGNDQQLVMKFDVDETWTTDPVQRGVLMLNVATHEFGHLLGLTHSNVATALMAPYYSVGVSVPQQSDDVPRIQARYGAPGGTTPLPPVPPTPPVPPQPTTHTLTVTGPVFLDGRQIA